jgi:hypothetical protein
MIPNKRDLKAFIRMDYDGRIVAGSLILRKKMPKVGKWLEIPAYECCNNPNTTTITTTSFICKNIILNGGFESWTGEGPEDWSGGTQEGTIVHSGSYSVELNPRMGSSIFQYFTPTSNCITLDFWYNTAVESCAGFSMVRLHELTPPEYLQVDGSWGELSVQHVYPATDGWVNITEQIYTNAGDIHVLILLASCTAYFDDVQICDGCDPAVTTTTTTTCIVPEGYPQAPIFLAHSYTNGETVDFINSGDSACEGISQGIGVTFNFIEYDVYGIGEETTVIYLTGTCTLIPNGYYVYEVTEGNYSVVIFENGINTGNYVCPTPITTTTTTTIFQG